MTSMTRTTEPIVHPSWCDPTRCDVEHIAGKPTGDVCHWTADIEPPSGPFPARIALARVDNGDNVGATAVYVQGLGLDGEVAPDDLEALGHWLTAQAGAARRRIGHEDGIGPIVCAPWCEYGHGHRDELFPADQRCTSAPSRTTLTLPDPGQMSDGTWQQPVLEVFAEEGPRFPLSIHIYEMGGDVDLTLTVAEARQLAAALLAHVEMIEGAR